MGFEQLAALRDQLARQAQKDQPKPAKAAKPAQSAKAGKPAGTAPARGGQESPKARPPRRPRDASQARPVPAVTPDLPIAAAVGRLQRRFPRAFPRQGEPKLPLKVGILADLQPNAAALGLTEAQVQAALAAWCQGLRYWASLTEGAARVDLTGASTGTVTASEAAWGRQQANQRTRRRRTEAAPAQAQAAAATDATAAPAAAEAVAPIESVEPVESVVSIESVEPTTPPTPDAAA